MQNSFKKFKKGPLILSLIFLLIASAVFVFIYQKIQDNNTAFAEAQDLWQKENSKKEEAKSIEQALKMLENEKVSLDSHFIKSSDIVPLLDTIEKLAPKVGATSEVDSVDMPADGSGLIVGVKSTGSFEAVYRFLTLLENSPYQLQFISVDMQKSDTAASSRAGKVLPWSGVFKIKILSFTE